MGAPLRADGTWRYGQRAFRAENDEGRVVGFVAGGPSQTTDECLDCELYAIYLYQEEQGKGLGSKLARELAKWLDERGFWRMCVWVLQGNPSQKFYERIGGTAGPTKEEDVAGTKALHIRYDYDVKDLLERLGR